MRAWPERRTPQWRGVQVRGGGGGVGCGRGWLPCREQRPAVPQLQRVSPASAACPSHDGSAGGNGGSGQRPRMALHKAHRTHLQGRSRAACSQGPPGSRTQVADAGRLLCLLFAPTHALVLVRVCVRSNARSRRGRQRFLCQVCTGAQHAITALYRCNFVIQRFSGVAWSIFSARWFDSSSLQLPQLKIRARWPGLVIVNQSLLST